MLKTPELKLSICKNSRIGIYTTDDKKTIYLDQTAIEQLCLTKPGNLKRHLRNFPITTVNEGHRSKVELYNLKDISTVLIHFKAPIISSTAVSGLGNFLLREAGLIKDNQIILDLEVAQETLEDQKALAKALKIQTMTDLLEPTISSFDPEELPLPPHDLRSAVRNNVEKIGERYGLKFSEAYRVIYGLLNRQTGIDALDIAEKESVVSGMKIRPLDIVEDRKLMSKLNDICEACLA